jgi:Arc/MetJ-type ribon-helix-helix transcriptional regulator
MRIITVNLPESYLKALDDLSGDDSKHPHRKYPSRSEAIRVAVREFLIKELESVHSFTNFQQQISQKAQKPAVNETYIQVPIDSDEIANESSEKGYHTYRIIKK